MYMRQNLGDDLTDAPHRFAPTEPIREHPPKPTEPVRETHIGRRYRGDLGSISSEGSTPSKLLSSPFEGF